MISSFNDGERDISVNDGKRDILLDRILTNLDRFQAVKNQLKLDIEECFSIDLVDENGAYFNATRKKSVIHFMIRKLLRFSLDCVESCKKYYGDDLSTQSKVELLIKAASSFEVFDVQPPDISSKYHPSFNESTTEGKSALRLYHVLDALRQSVTRKKNIKKIAKVPSSPDKVTSSLSSSSNQPTSVLGKRTSSSMESSPLGATNTSPLEPLNPTTIDEVTSSSSSRINQPSSIMGKLSSSVASVFNSLSVIIGGRTAEENEDEKEKTGMNLREELDNTENADDESVECPRGSTKIGEDVCFLT